MKRILLFLLTNIAILVVLSLICSVLGVDRYLTRHGLNLPMLLAFSAASAQEIRTYRPFGTLREQAHCGKDQG